MANIVLSTGWYLSKHPVTGVITINIPEINSSAGVFKKFEVDYVWLKISDNTTYILDWQSNARSLYDRHQEKCECQNVCVWIPIPDDFLDNVLLPFSETCQIMDNICE